MSEQKPIGYMDKLELHRWDVLRGTSYEEEEQRGFIGFSREPFKTSMTDCSLPVYTAPPKREWVGLTDKELQDLCAKSYCKDSAGETHFNRGHFADAIEAKLKEKNT